LQGRKNKAKYRALIANKSIPFMSREVFTRKPLPNVTREGYNGILTSFKKVAQVFEKYAKYTSCKIKFKKLQKHKKPLTPEERALVMKSKAVWNFHFGRDGKRQATPAVWKSVQPDGRTIYVTNTHRAFNTAPTVKGAINRYHTFIKGTA